MNATGGLTLSALTLSITRLKEGQGDITPLVPPQFRAGAFSVAYSEAYDKTTDPNSESGP